MLRIRRRIAELLTQQLEYPQVRPVAPIEEIEDNHVVLLTVAVATSNALFNALGVPRKVVIDHERAELEVHTFGSGFSGNQYRSLVTKMLDNGGFYINGS